jgi:predicted phosphate transport protein (TIGR00153 family)
MRLLPREEKFFVFFQRQCQITTEAAQTLLDGVKRGNSRLAEMASRIKTLEQKGDDLIHEVADRLNETFITPIDPEDIHTLASRMDDVLDCIEETAYRIVAYRLDPIPPPVVKFSEIVNDCCKALGRAFDAMSKGESMQKDCIEVNRLEETADDLGRASIADLFANEKDPIALIKCKEIYEVLEKTTDFCEDVADVLQGVAVKNS